VKLLVRTLLTALATTAVAAGVSLPAHAAVVPSRASTVTTVTVTPYPSAHGSVTGIVASVCHSLSRWSDIAKENNITAPYIIHPGQRIVVRCLGAATTHSSQTVVRSNSPWVTPLPGAVCSSGYQTKARPGHMGIDLLRPWGTPIRAAAAGTVVFVGYEARGAGWYLKIRHSASLFTVYMHMPAPSLLAVGTRVHAGQVIGRVGASGDATGPHLHFEVRTALYYHQLNPATFLRTHGVRVVGC
jgi:murein DD-endopeptidase MepM/ murein hydrolase activator NlpD